MDLYTKSMTERPRGVRVMGHRGVAMPTALFALLMVSVLAMGMWSIVDINTVSSVNRVDAARALSLSTTKAPDNHAPSDAATSTPAQRPHPVSDFRLGATAITRLKPTPARADHITRAPAKCISG